MKRIVWIYLAVLTILFAVVARVKGIKMTLANRLQRLQLNRLMPNQLTPNQLTPNQLAQ